MPNYRNATELDIAKRKLREQWNVRRYTGFKRCTCCGTLNQYRTPAGVCLACLASGVAKRAKLVAAPAG
jgi:hypothetical protein